MSPHRCIALTHEGERCRRPAPLSEFCPQHARRRRAGRPVSRADCPHCAAGAKPESKGTP